MDAYQKERLQGLAAQARRVLEENAGPIPADEASTQISQLAWRLGGAEVMLQMLCDQLDKALGGAS